MNSKQLENWDIQFSSCEILDDNDNEKENLRNCRCFLEVF